MGIPGVSLAVLKSRLGISDTSSDAVLNGILCGAERSVVVYLGYDPSSAQAVEYYSTNGTRFLPLARKPVTSVVTVHEDRNGLWGQGDDAFNSDTLLTEGDNYALERDGVTGATVLVRVGAVWPYTMNRPLGRLGLEAIPAPGVVRVEYVAGYTADQMGDIAEAVLAQAAALWTSRATGLGPFQSESLDGYSRSLGSSAQLAGQNPALLSPIAELLLRPHKRPRYA